MIQAAAYGKEDGIKKEVIRQVISDDDGSVTSASLEDIAYVLD